MDEYLFTPQDLPARKDRPASAHLCLQSRAPLTPVLPRHKVATAPQLRLHAIRRTTNPPRRPMFPVPREFDPLPKRDSFSAERVYGTVKLERGCLTRCGRSPIASCDSFLPLEESPPPVPPEDFKLLRSKTSNVSSTRAMACSRDIIPASRVDVPYSLEMFISANLLYQTSKRKFSYRRRPVTVGGALAARK
eukprot:GEMP01083706.1.p1 GENE.GEMP01083706.1~~GEMP01083706.1.p1  ORF type:complete len:192 (+),score=41.31 GEMP01083706.1:182-757(+)